MAKRKPYTWQQNLRLLADEGTPKRLPTGVTGFTPTPRKDIAARLGVSTRTLRRWLNEGATPSPDNQKRIQQAGKGRRTALKRAGYPDLARIPYGHRRQLKNWDFTNIKPKWDGTTRDSRWINYYFKGWEVFDIMQFLMKAQGYGNAFQIFYYVNSKKRPDRHGMAATKILPSLDEWTPKGLEEFLWSLIYDYDVESDEDKNEIIWIGLLATK